MFSFLGFRFRVPLPRETTRWGEQVVVAVSGKPLDLGQFARPIADFVAYDRI